MTEWAKKYDQMIKAQQEEAAILERIRIAIALRHLEIAVKTYNRGNRSFMDKVDDFLFG